jgi:hypothetical protein
MMRTAFNLPLRQIEGLVTSVITLIGIIGNFITRGLTVVWSGREIVGPQPAYLTAPSQPQCNPVGSMSFVTRCLYCDICR